MTCQTKIKLKRPYTEGDTNPPIRAVMIDVDLTGKTLELFLERPDGTTVRKLPAVPTPTTGYFELYWGASDLIEGLDQLVQVRVTDGAEVETQDDFYIDVKRKLVELP